MSMRYIDTQNGWDEKVSKLKTMGVFKPSTDIAENQWNQSLKKNNFILI